MIVGGKQQKVKLEVSDVYTKTDISHSSWSATGTQEHIKQCEPKAAEYASTYVAAAWDGYDVSILEASSASEDSDGTEVYSQQLEESKENKREVADVEDKTEMGGIEDSHDLTETEGGKVTEAVHNESKKAEKSEVSDADTEEGKQIEVTEVVENGILLISLILCTPLNVPTKWE